MHTLPVQNFETTKTKSWASFFHESRGRFTSYWLHYLQEHATAYDRLDADEENIYSAWMWAAKHGQEKALLQALDSLYYYYKTRGRLSDGKEVFAATLAQFEKGDGDLTRTSIAKQKLVGRLLAHQAWFCQNLGQYSRAEMLSNLAMALLQKIDDQSYLAYLMLVKANVTLAGYGNAKRAQQLNHSAYEMYRELQHQKGMVNSLIHLGVSHNEANEHAAAKPFLLEAIAICNAHKNDFQLEFAQSISNLGMAYEGLGNFTEAVGAHQASFEMCEQLQNKMGMAYSLANQSQIALRLSCFAEAKNLSQLQLRFSYKIGHNFLIAVGLADLGNAYYMLGEFEQAWESLREGLDVAILTSSKPAIIQLIAQIARFLYHLGKDLESLILLSILQSFPLSHRHVGNPANLYEILIAELPDVEVKIIQVEWQEKPLDEAINLIRKLSLSL